MTTEIIENLCGSCGLCCDGSIFNDVALAGTPEVTRMIKLGVEVDPERPPLLLQPCTALQGTRCRIYQRRPACCRTFECRLLQRTKRGSVSM